MNAMFACTKCGYVYNPKSGDTTQGVAPGVPFEKLPAAWRCPRCKADRSKFVKME